MNFWRKLREKKQQMASKREDSQWQPKKCLQVNMKSVRDSGLLYCHSHKLLDVDQKGKPLKSQEKVHYYIAQEHFGRSGSPSSPKNLAKDGSGLMLGNKYKNDSQSINKKYTISKNTTSDTSTGYLYRSHRQPN